MGEKERKPFQLTFNGLSKVDFQGSRVTSDGGLILVRELDERLGLGELIEQHLADSRHYNLGNRWRRLGLPHTIKSWSLTNLQHRLMKTGGRLIKHPRYYGLLFAEGHLHRRFGDMLRRIWALPLPNG